MTLVGNRMSGRGSYKIVVGYNSGLVPGERLVSQLDGIREPHGRVFVLPKYDQERAMLKCAIPSIYTLTIGYLYQKPVISNL